MLLRDTIRLGLVTTTFLTGTALVAVAQTEAEMPSDAGEPPIDMAAVTTEMPTDAAAEPAPVDGQYFRISVPVAGTYILTAPASSGLAVRVDGALILDLSNVSGSDTAQPVRAVFALTPGDHVVRIDGAVESLEGLTFNRLGALPEPLIEIAEAVSADDAVIASTAAAAAAETAAPASAQSPRRLSAALRGSPFMIGGRSSRIGRGEGAAAAREARSGTGIGAAPAMGATGTAAAPADGASGGSSGGTRVASGGGSQSSGGGSASSDGGTTVLPAAFRRPGGSGGGSAAPGAPTTPGAPAAPGTPTAGPTPAPTPTPTPTPPPPAPTPAAGAATASPLAPPANPVLTQAVELTTGGTAEQIVARTGQTLFGAVMDATAFDIVNVTVGPTGRATTVDVGPMTGQFAVRLFPEDFAQGNEVTVSLVAANSSNTEVATQATTYTFTGGDATDGLTQALSRLTFGATPELYARVRAIGFPAYLEEQLNPETIDDSAFLGTSPDDLLDETTRNNGRMFNSIMDHNVAYAAFTERQLQEVMGTFWWNHFHASTKGSDIVHQNIVDRQFFRENAFGRFEDLLLYSARSPLMSQFLDNDQSRAGNINENYGREVLELHTVGVNGGYTDEDVIAVSRVFTGWRYERTNPNQDDVAERYEFEFEPDRHDTDDKVIPFINTTIAGRSGPEGVQEGEELIAILAADPRTQGYVCGKIVQKLVADQPPAALVSRCVEAWAANDGSTREILRAVLSDPLFIQSAEFQRTKGKTPFEYAVSVIRAFGAQPDTGDDNDFYRRFREATTDAGQAPFYFPVPTGLPEVGSAWTNTASMIARYNEMANVAERTEQYGIDLMAEIEAAGLETAEEVAAYLLTVATADRFRVEEFEAVVDVLKGEDGIFEPRTQDEKPALDRAVGLVVVLPSFQLQ